MKYKIYQYKNSIKFTNLFLILIFLLFTLYAIKSYLLYTGIFNNYNVNIIGNKFIDSHLIKQKIYHELPSSLLSININNIQNELQSIEFIDFTQVSIILPNTLVIIINEREPIFLIKDQTEKNFIDKKGVILEANDNAILSFNVPIISIKKNKHNLNNYHHQIPQMSSFIINEYPNFYKNLNKITIEKNLWKFYNNENTVFHMDDLDLLNQLYTLKIFEDTIYPIKTLKDYSQIDLRFKDKIVVKEKYHKG